MSMSHFCTIIQARSGEGVIPYNDPGADPGFFFRRGCTRLLLYFNTNKAHSFFFFFCRIPVVLENRGSFGGGGGDLYGKVSPERGTFFRLQIYIRVGILVVAVHMIGKGNLSLRSVKRS